MSPKRILVLAIATSALASSAALAATGTPDRVRGVITSAAGNSVTVDTYTGKTFTVALTDKTAYLKVEKSSLDKIDKGMTEKNLTDLLGPASTNVPASSHWGRMSLSRSGARAPRTRTMRS